MVIGNPKDYIFNGNQVSNVITTVFLAGKWRTLVKNV